MTTILKVFCLLIILAFAMLKDLFSQDIYSAIENGNVELVKQCIEQNPELLNQRNRDLLTPLNLAAERNQPEAAAFLLSKGADPSIGDNENSQPIHLAAISGSIAIVDMLLDKGVRIDTRDVNLMTPLLFAISRGQTEMTHHLIGLGADVKAESIQGTNAILMATIGGRLEIVKMLAEEGANVNSANNEGIRPLHSAVSYGRTDVLKYLVENGADIRAVNNEGDQPLAWAVGRNSYDAAQYLISKGADVNHKNPDGFTALHNATGRGNMAVIKLFVESGADVNAATTTGLVPLAYAAWTPNAEEVARLLILSGADVNPDPCLNNKACTCGPNFTTPLHFACQSGKLEMAKVLVENGAKINLFNQQGLTPLLLAVRSGSTELVNYLSEQGAFLNVPYRDDEVTELHTAAAMGFGDIAQLLIEKGSDPSMKDAVGETPLDYAFYYGQDRVGYDILAAGADDEKLAGYIASECLLSKSIPEGEAEVSYLGHSGWAIRTQNHFLVFDYFDDTRTRKPDHPCLASGCLDTNEIKGIPLTCFVSHEHADHFSPSIFTFSDNNPGSDYILCFRPAGVSDPYTYVPVNSEMEIDGMKIYVIKSTDSGGGYLVEVDGLTIFHMGDHANGEDALMTEFTHEIDLVAAKNINIDIMFGPIRGCSLGTPAQVKAGTYFAINKLHPEIFVPMHSGSYTFENKTFIDEARADGIDQPMMAVSSKGDRFHYSKGEAMVDNVSTDPQPGSN